MFSFFFRECHFTLGLSCCLFVSGHCIPRIFYSILFYSTQHTSENTADILESVSLTSYIISYRGDDDKTPKANFHCNNENDTSLRDGRGSLFLAFPFRGNSNISVNISAATPFRFRYRTGQLSTRSTPRPAPATRPGRGK